MLQEYEICEKTLAIIPVDDNISKVLEEDTIYFVGKKTTDIVDDSCRYFGSSYIGRFEGTKHILGYNYKAPIIIEETRQLIFFPTASPRFNNCTWINLNSIKKYTKQLKHSVIVFKNGKELLVDISYNSLENQIFRATRLESILNERINLKK